MTLNHNPTIAFCSGKRLHWLAKRAGGRPETLILALLALMFSAFLSTAASAQGPRVLVLGDSLVAGYGLRQGEDFVSQLQARLDAAGVEAQLVNGGVSGDTSADALARLDWALADGPDAVILELGANDMLRGLSPRETRKNLTAILDRLSREGLPVLITGMLANRGLGADYYREFDAIYPELAQAYGARFYPFFLEGVVQDAALNQPDLMHPNAKGVAVIVENILPHVTAFLEAVAARATASPSS